MTTKGSTTMIIIIVIMIMIIIRNTKQPVIVAAARQSSFCHNLVIEPRDNDGRRRRTEFPMVISPITIIIIIQCEELLYLRIMPRFGCPRCCYIARVV